MEDVALAVGERIRHASVKSAAQVSRSVVLFVEKVQQVKELVEVGLSVNGTFEQMMSLTQPAARITLSNVPPFISDDFVQELSCHGKVVSPIKKLQVSTALAGGSTPEAALHDTE